MSGPPVDPECAAVGDDLTALALGTLSGRERATVVGHLERCPDCAAELEELSAAADALLTVVPEEAPPDGFAARTVALMGGRPDPRAGVVARTGRRPARWRVAAVAAAVVVALGIGLGVGRALAPSGGAGSSGGARTAALSSPSGATGTVVVSPGGGGWLVMTVADVPASGEVTCVVTLADGSHRTVGRFSLSTGYASPAYGSWAVHLPVPASSVRSVAVVDAHGATVASATLPS